MNTESEFKTWTKPCWGSDETGAAISRDPLSLAGTLGTLERGTQHTPLQANPATAHMFVVIPLKSGGLMNLFNTYSPCKRGSGGVNG